MRTVAETGSTNSDVLALAAAGAPEGEWLVAGRQTAGRGRLGRHWVSEPGNLFASTLVRARAGDPAVAGLALVAGIAVHGTIAALTGDPARLQLKWPNDVLVDGAKVAGILLERQDDAVAVGIGINLRHAPALDRRVAALGRPAAESPTDIVTFRLAPAFADVLARWRGRDGPARILGDWTSAAHPIGTPLRVAQADGSAIDGRFDGLEAGGALRLRLAGGAAHVIHAGDVSLVRDL